MALWTCYLERKITFSSRQAPFLCSLIRVDNKATNASSLVFFSSFAQTGTFAALPGALEIAGSFRTRRQPAHHPQPADEGQRSHQGGVPGLLSRRVFPRSCASLNVAFISTLQKLEESDKRAQHTMDQLQREQRYLRRRLEQLGVERTRMDSTGSNLSSDKSDSDQGGLAGFGFLAAAT